MPLYEFVLQIPDRPDEIRISDHDGAQEGDAVVIGSRRWIAIGRQVVDGRRLNGVPVSARIILKPDDRR